MALSVFSSRSKVINLVFNDQYIRYVELKQSTPPVPLRWGEKKLSPGMISDGKIVDFDTLSMVIDECIQDWKINKREVRFIVPDSIVIIRKLSIPSDIAVDEINSYIYLELGATIHLPFEHAVFDTVIMSKAGEKQEIILFAAPEKNVLEYSDLLSEAKLKPIAADISPLANYRLFSAATDELEKANAILVQFDTHLVSMTIFEGAFPLFLRHLSIELNDWLNPDAMSVQQDGVGQVNELNYQFEDVYKEISKLMDFYTYSFTQGKKMIEQIAVNGDHPLFERILAEMGERFTIPVKPITYDGSLHAEMEEFPRSYYLGLGLGLKEVK
ncbi:pilus assembly protein PilM [Mesobacillus subterraneus]|uniref:type IV pilus biogenesis protein PilM n=1 Tax=Mesobacillus subterraneus TaxID=285983 RepID=UPI001CFF31F2|nr:pilus assembly protein PilM [Mesobacillus subterraneus]WLR56187.1 pilus assembly protein PilM [Mesobacillus subterraneus]